MAGIYIRLIFWFAAAQIPLQGSDVAGWKEAKIREILNSDERVDSDELARLGGYAPSAYLLYSRILDDPTEERYVIARTLWLLSEPCMKGDRSQFVERAVAKLSHSHSGVRRNALGLLAQIGTARDAPPIVALLSDSEWSVALAAAKTLAAIGDRRSVAAMDVWLNSVTPRNSGNDNDNVVLRKEVLKYRDELKQRLEKAKLSEAVSVPAPRRVKSKP